jgi:tetratricopeptide (TPR) repeat protein
MEVSPPLPRPWKARPLDLQSLVAAELRDVLRLAVQENTELPHLQVPAPSASLLREALALALIRLAAPLDFRTGALHRWQSDFSAVMFERALSLPKVRRSDIPLLSTGYQVLEALVALRASAVTLAGCRSKLETLQKPDALPLAFLILYWWEATYRLTETGDFEGAEQAHLQAILCARQLKALLPGMPDEVDSCLLGLQHGRLAYYSGDFRLALLCFELEWKNLTSAGNSGRSSVQTHEARLLREVANVLTDLGHLDAAESLIRRAIAIQAQLSDPELYKSLGRLGEILLRNGDPDGATAQFSRSLALQELDGLPGDQTLTYLGHAALLAGRLTDAENHYRRAEDTMAASASTSSAPYLWMGRIALARARSDADALRSLAATRHSFDDLTSARVLPRAVAIIGLWLSGAVESVELDRELEALSANGYSLESLYGLPLRHPTPEDCRNVLATIAEQLRQWDEAARQARMTILGERDHPQPPLAAGCYASAIDAALAENTWAPLLPLTARTHPFHLLSVARV